MKERMLARQQASKDGSGTGWFGQSKVIVESLPR